MSVYTGIELTMVAGFGSNQNSISRQIAAIVTAILVVVTLN